jgi:ABC-type amino acid transport substrate-binding protein
MSQTAGMLALVCLLCLFVFLLTGCAAEQTQQVEEQKNTEYKEELLQKNTLTVLTSLDYAPFEAGNAECPWGFDIAVAQELANRLDLQLAIVTHERATLLSALTSQSDASQEGGFASSSTQQNEATGAQQGSSSDQSSKPEGAKAESSEVSSGKAANSTPSSSSETISKSPVADIAIAALAITQDRSSQVDFSSWYYAGNQAVVTLKGAYQATSEFNSEKTRIAVVKGSTCATTAQSFTNEKLVAEYSTAEKCMEALQAKEVQAVVLDLPVASYLLDNGFSNAEILERVMTGEPYGIAIPQESSKLKDAINEALEEMEEDGTLDKLEKEYLRNYY